MATFFIGGAIVFNADALAAAAPKGSYKKTCKDIRTDANGLYATCKTTNGKWKKTSLSSYVFPCKDIENDNGNLVCVGPSRK